MSESWYSDEALAKQAEADALRSEGKEVPLTMLVGILEPRVHATEDERCRCCGTDARDEVGGEEHDGWRWCSICVGRGHHEEGA